MQGGNIMKLIRAVAAIALLVTATAWAQPILTITPINNNAIYSPTTTSIPFAFHVENTGNATLNWNGFAISQTAIGPPAAGCCSFNFTSIPFSNPGSLAAGAFIDWTALVINALPAGSFLPVGFYRDTLSISFDLDGVVVASARATAVAAVAEPTSLALLLIGLAAFAATRLRKRMSASG
jgi:hypothetical protein